MAKPISSLSLDESFTASGIVFVCAGDGHTLLGFFNAGTINEWRTPNTVAIRIYGRGADFQVYSNTAPACGVSAAGA